MKTENGWSSPDPITSTRALDDEAHGSPAWLGIAVLIGALLSGYGVCSLLAWLGRSVLAWIS